MGQHGRQAVSGSYGSSTRGTVGAAEARGGADARPARHWLPRRTLAAFAASFAAFSAALAALRASRSASCSSGE